MNDGWNCSVAFKCIEMLKIDSHPINRQLISSKAFVWFYVGLLVAPSSIVDSIQSIEMNYNFNDHQTDNFN